MCTKARLDGPGGLSCWSIALVVLLSTRTAVCQPLTITPTTIQGLELVGPDSPEYSALVTQIVGEERPVGLAAALPYGFVIRNATGHSLAAVGTVWTAGDQVLLNAADAMFGKEILYIQPGQSVLSVPPGILQNARQLRIFADGTTEHIRMENFQHPGPVTVTVDAVVFESGRFAGANRYGAFEQWKAQIEAPRDLAQAVLKRRDKQSISEIMSWLEGLAAVRRVPADPHERETIPAARVLVSVYRSKGEAELYARAKSVVETPVFPLHR